MLCYVYINAFSCIYEKNNEISCCALPRSTLFCAELRSRLFAAGVFGQANQSTVVKAPTTAPTIISECIRPESNRSNMQIKTNCIMGLIELDPERKRASCRHGMFLPLAFRGSLRRPLP